MVNLKKNDVLKDKFNSAELKTASDLKFKIDENSFKEMAKVELRPVSIDSFLILNIFIKCFAVFLKTNKYILMTFKNDFMKPGMTFLFKPFSIIYLKIKRNNKQLESFVDHYLTQLDEKINVHFNSFENTKIEDLTLFYDFESAIRKKFEFGNCRVNVTSTEKNQKEFTHTCDFDLEVFDFIILSLNESQLISNVDNLSIKISIDKKIIKNIIEFELKFSGNDWAFAFSKNVSSLIHQKIKIYSGKTTGQHIYNVTQIKDVFIFSFSYQKVEIKEVVNDVESYSKKLEPSEMELLTEIKKDFPIIGPEDSRDA